MVHSIRFDFSHKDAPDTDKLRLIYTATEEILETLQDDGSWVAVSRMPYVMANPWLLFQGYVPKTTVRAKLANGVQCAGDYDIPNPDGEYLENEADIPSYLRVVNAGIDAENQRRTAYNDELEKKEKSAIGRIFKGKQDKIDEESAKINAKKKRLVAHQAVQGLLDNMNFVTRLDIMRNKLAADGYVLSPDIVINIGTPNLDELRDKFYELKPGVNEVQSLMSGGIQKVLTNPQKIGDILKLMDKFKTILNIK